MGWKSVAWASCLLPVLAGCSATRNLTIDSHFACSTRGVEYDLRMGAPTPAPSVRDQLARPTFVGAPVVPYIQSGASEPVASAAPATRSGPGIPFVPISAAKQPKKGPNPPPPENGKFGEPATPNEQPALAKDDDALPPFPGIGTSIPSRPRPEVPVIPPFNPTLLPGDKFAPLPMPLNPDLLPVPNPPLPIPNFRPELPPAPAEEPLLKIPPVLEQPGRAAPFSLKSSPALPAVLEVIPVAPFQPGTPVVIPVSGTLPRK